jgi:hypothetical protein
MLHRLVVELRDNNRLLVAYQRLPYQFASVPKAKRNRVRSRDDLQSQYTPSQRDSSYPLQGLQSGPPIPTSPAVRRSEQSSHRYSALPQRPHPQHIRQPSQHDTNNSSAILERLAPSEGPLPGGLRILLSGANFPPPPECIYARFGSLVTQTVREIRALRWKIEIDPALSSGITRIHLNAYYQRHHIQGWCQFPCPYIITRKDLLSDRVTAGSNTLLTVNACASSAFRRCPS